MSERVTQLEIVRVDYTEAPPWGPAIEQDPYAPSVSEIVEATRYFMDRSRKVLEGKSVRDYDEAWSRLNNLISRLEE